MAKKEEVVVTCDFDDAPAVSQNLHFIYDGNLYEADLCEIHVREYLRILFDFKLMGRKLGKAKSPKSTSVRNRNAARRAHDARVREWAQDHEMPISDHGRIPNTVKQAYAMRNQV